MRTKHANPGLETRRTAAASAHAPAARLVRASAIFLIAAGCLAAVSCAKRPAALRIGVVFSFTGSSSTVAEEVRSGLDLALAEIASAGGSARVELLYRDDSADAGKIPAAVKELAQEGCSIIVGPLTSGLAPAMIRAAAEAGLPVLSPTVSSSALAGLDDGFSRLFPTTRELASSLGRRAAASKTLRPCLVFDSANPAFAAEWAAEFEAPIVAAGGASFSARIEFQGGAGFDAAGSGRAVAASGSDSVLIVASPTHTALLLIELDRLGYRGRIYSSTWAVTSLEPFLAVAGPSAEGLESILLFDPASAVPAWRSFVERYEARTGLPPTSGAALGYESLLAVLAADRASGYEKAGLPRALRSLSFEGLQGTVRLDEHGDVARPATPFVVRDGRALLEKGAAR